MMEGRTIDYRPDGGGLDYHNSPLMAEIPIDNYSHIHRSIEHLRSIGVPPPLDHHRHHIATNLTDLRRYEPDEIPEVKPSVLRLSEYKAGLQEIRSHNDQENDQRQMTPHDDTPKGYSAPSTPLSENGGQILPEEKVRINIFLQNLEPREGNANVLATNEVMSDFNTLFWLIRSYYSESRRV